MRTAPDDAGLFDDSHHGEAPVALRQLDLFALNPAMQQYLTEKIIRRGAVLGHSRGLFEALTGDLKLDYDASVTRTASETFDARAGNCLSLVILASAFGKQLGTPLHYQLVHGEGAWTRTGGIVFLNGHVNILLDPYRRYGLMTGTSEPGLLIDFSPASGVRSRDVEEIAENTIIAMYMNNRAAETLVDGRIDEAYWWARSAVREDPSFVSAYNTLGVIYRRSGDLARAERVFSTALREAPRDPQLLVNLAVLYGQQGRSADAAGLRRRLASLDAYQPFQFLDAGYAAMAAGAPAEAMDLYRKELQHMPYSAEVHYAIAAASARLGDAGGARLHLAQAVQLSSNIRERDIYAGKLQRLQALHVN
ncbi:MAG: tetratricopeptide repeat protein [Solimonas sp.]